MRNHHFGAGTVAGAALLVTALWPRDAVPQSPPEPSRTPVPQYLGAAACASCHKSKATGNQFETWKASAHARAYRTLGTAQAKAIGARLGLQGEPQLAPRCLRCHTTAAGESRGRIAESFDVAEGVQCEACHGPGSEYSKIQNMIQIESAVKLGLQHPDATVCKKCHNDECPTFAGFDHAASVKKIKHSLAPL